MSRQLPAGGPNHRHPLAMLIAAISVAVLAGGCRQESRPLPQKPSPLMTPFMTASPVSTTSSHAAASSPSEPDVALAAVVDYVLHPPVDPQEATWPPDAPSRIVTLAPNLTEAVFALGAGDRLVGRDSLSDYPPTVSNIPDAGSFVQRSLEQVVVLRPDLVLMTRSEVDRAQALSALGLRVVVTPDGSLAEIGETIRLVGEALGRPLTAARLWSLIEADLAHAQRHLARRSHAEDGPLRVLLLPGSFSGDSWPLYAAGRSSYFGEFLQAAGCELPTGGAAWPAMSAEAVIAFRPHLVVECRHAAPSAAEVADARRHWAALGINEPQTSIRLVRGGYLLRPGPRVNLAMHALTAEIAGDASRDAAR